MSSKEIQDIIMEQFKNMLNWLADEFPDNTLLQTKVNFGKALMDSKKSHKIIINQLCSFIHSTEKKQIGFIVSTVANKYNINCQQISKEQYEMLTSYCECFKILYETMN